MAKYKERIKQAEKGLEASEYKFFTLAELSALLGISDVALRQFIKVGKLRGIKMAGKWRVQKTALDEFIASGGGGPEGALPRRLWSPERLASAEKREGRSGLSSESAAPDKEGE